MMENGEESTEGMTEVENKSLDVAEDVKTDEEELPDVVMNAKAPVNNEEKWMLQMNRQRSVASEHEEGEDTDESLLEVIVALHYLQNENRNGEIVNRTRQRCFWKYSISTLKTAKKLTKLPIRFFI